MKMKRCILYLLPNQLFSKDELSKAKTKHVILWEHPDFFTKYRFNKKKLILHRSSMKKHYDYLTKHSYHVQYIEFNILHDVSKTENAIMFDPINDIDDFKNTPKLESPNFLVTKDFNQRMYNNKKNKHSIRFTTYYFPRVKQEINILENTASTDKENRKNISKVFPNYKRFPQISKKDEKYIVDATDYVEKHFQSNYGVVTDFNYPIDNRGAKRWLKIFLETRLQYFGTYQDTIVEGENMLYHSGLSSSLNIGIIHPSYILKRIEKYETLVSMNNYEGYIRQLIWREYQRYCYLFLKKDLAKRNQFILNNRLDERKEWYSGNTGVYPVDVAIKKAFDSGYLHHIERLMIIGNFMLLSQIRKEDGFRWFMEFAIDSYEWVMYQNVYDMVFYSTGGATTHKAYISSSKYVLKMSNYQKGKWTSDWDTKYRQFKEKFF
jgi:deoxyribodipyrimidine photolyase-related protein